MELKSSKKALILTPGFIRIMIIPPFLAGLLILTESLLPLTSSVHEITDKRTHYRSRFKRTTYSISFHHYTEQFTPEIYEALHAGELVELNRTAFTKETREVFWPQTGRFMVNSTGEKNYQIAFAIAYLLSGLIWFYKGDWHYNWKFATIGMIILLGTISLIRIVIFLV